MAKYTPIAYTVTSNDAGKRIDKLARRLLLHKGLSGVYSALRKKLITVNGKKVKPSYSVHEGDCIEVAGFLLPEGQKESPEPGEAGGYSGEGSAVIGDIGEDRSELGGSKRVHELVIFENDHILALNKPKGIEVHGADSLEAQVRAYLASVIPNAIAFRPGPLHRLDRNSTGLILYGKSIHGARRFSALLQERQCTKQYLGLVDGALQEEQQWEDFLAKHKAGTMVAVDEHNHGKKAETTVYPLVQGKSNTLCLFTILTGRTHQIRVQSSLHGCPLSGDKKYGGSHFPGGFFLHSRRLILPRYDDIMGFSKLEAPLWPEVEATLCKLFGLQKASLQKLLP